MAPQKRKNWVATSTCKEGSWIPGLDSPGFSRCRCSHCAAVLADTTHWTSLRKPPLRCRVATGDRVAVRRRRRSPGRDCGEEEKRVRGVVKYVGDLNSPHTNDPIYVGIKLDDPVGEHDGLFGGKRFFSCPEGHGLILPATEVQPLTTNNKNRRSGALNSTVCASEKERVRSSGGTERTLESMLNKSWARKRISAVSGAGSDGGRSRSSLHSQNIPTPSTSVPEEGEVVTMGEEKREGLPVQDAGTEYSNEGDLFVEDVEGDADRGGIPPRVVVERVWRSVPTVMEEDQRTMTESEPSKMRPSGRSEILTSTTAKIGAQKTRRGCSSAVGCEKRWSKHTSMQFSGLSGAVSSDQATRAQGGDSRSSSGGIDSSVPVLKNVESSLAKQQGDPHPIDNWTESSQESLTTGPGCQVGPEPIQDQTSPPIETLDSNEEVELVSSMTLPPVPPGTSASNTSSSCSDQFSPITRQDSLSSCAISWPPTPSSSLPPNEQVTAEVGTVQCQTPSLCLTDKEMEGEKRVRMMAATYQRLRKALKRGVQEMQWQRKIREIESSGLYPAQTWRFMVLRENAGLNRDAATAVKRETSSLRRRKGDKLACVATAQAKLETEEGKGRVAHNIITSYQSSGKIRDIKKLARGVLKRKN